MMFDDGMVIGKLKPREQYRNILFSLLKPDDNFPTDFPKDPQYDNIS